MFTLTVLACAMVSFSVITFMRPVIDLLNEIQSICGLEDGIYYALLKAFGIGIVTEISASVAADVGNNSLAKMLRILGTSVILYLSIPIYSLLLDILKETTGGT